jgi:predicted nucleic acid-binding protein
MFPEYNQGRKVIWDGKDKDGKPFIDTHMPPHIRSAKNSSEMKITFTNGSIYQIIGADNYDSLVGPNPVGLILDEWAVSPKYPLAWNYFRPILVENKGWAVFPYTPRGRNHGWDLYQMALTNPEWFCQLLTIEDTKAISVEDVEAERQSGMSESMIQQEFYCSFLVSTDNILIQFELIQEALRRIVTQYYGTRVAGADCARYGDDRSTLVIRQGYNIIHAEKWKGLDNVQLASRYIDRYRMGFYDAIAIDTIGMPGVYDLVKNAGVPCVPVNVSESPSTHPERFKILRDELWWKLRELFVDRQCSISPSIPKEDRDALVADIQDVHYEYKGITNQIMVERKDVMKKRLGFSPDYGDALIHTFAPGIEMKVQEAVRVPYSGLKQQREETRDINYNPLTYGLA